MFSFKNVHYLGMNNMHLLGHSLTTFPTITKKKRFTAFTLLSNFKAFLVTGVDDFDMMH
jgi:hypothetical protein